MISQFPQVCHQLGHGSHLGHLPSRQAAGRSPLADRALKRHLDDDQDGREHVLRLVDGTKQHKQVVRRRIAHEDEVVGCVLVVARYVQ